MPYPRRKRRPIYVALRMPRLSRKGKAVLILLLLCLGAYICLRPASLYLRHLAGQMALSDATDMIILAVNNTIQDTMSQGEYDYDYFITLEKDEQGAITAISTNMAHINALAAQLLQDVVEITDSGVLDIAIPVGNLTGSNLLQGRGPEIPVQIVMLTSSRADFRNVLTEAGINQTKHEIILELTIDVDVLVPWEIMSTQVVTEVLVAESGIVGSVPDTYFNME